ncbi:hypothetical protein amrb99_01830 [Actinomadura sp. RB99]|nr:hypothetical protein [Actinomadura sp. RB99]
MPSMITRRGRTAGGALAGTVAALALAAAPAHADDATPYALPPLVAAGAAHDRDLAAEVAYWTTDRIARIGFNDDSGNENGQGADAYAPAGGWDTLSAPWSSGGLISRTAGKLLVHFHNTGNASDTLSTSCSANVVTSANQSVITAAGHCFRVDSNVGLTGTYEADNAVFIPGFNGASLARYVPGSTPGTTAPGPAVAPYGVWGVTRAWVTYDWHVHSNWTLGSDVGMAVVAKPGESRPIGQVVGAQNIAFGVSGNPKELYQFGYPTDNVRNWYWGKNNDGTNASYGVPASQRRGFDGRTMMYAHNSTTIDDAQLGNMGHDMASAMSPGSSGGPWLTGFDPATGTGTQIAVTSRFTNPTGDAPWYPWVAPSWQVGPWSAGQGFGVQSKAVYDLAQAATP